MRIYHLVLESELAACTVGGSYVPMRYAQDGFVHCTGDEATTLKVAQSYFSQAREPVVALAIETDRLSCPWRFEAPVPLPGGSAHRAENLQFPHVYGPILLTAVVDVGRLNDGSIDWQGAP